MKISVAIATYNGQKYIVEQLISIMNQSCVVDEVIICDDKSTDNTVQIIHDFININNLYNWKIYVNEKNLGFSNNFFEAIKRTTGNIIFLADQDDIWMKDKVIRMKNYFLADSTISAVASGMIFIDRDGNIDNNQKEMIFHGNMNFSGILPFSFFLGSSVIPGCTYAFKSSVKKLLVDENIPNLNLSLGHDWLIAIISAASGKFIRTTDILIKRRIHESNASKTSLRKSTLLTTDLQNRIVGFQQVVDAHTFLIQNNEILSFLNKSEIDGAKNIIRFFETRIKFAKTGNFLVWLELGLKFKMYLQCAKMMQVALQLYVADLLYAYRINWKIVK